jgi:hypothetical protein
MCQTVEKVFKQKLPSMPAEVGNKAIHEILMFLEMLVFLWICCEQPPTLYYVGHLFF